MEYGYVRVSTKEQNEQRQMIALREFGIEEKRIDAILFRKGSFCASLRKPNG